MVDAKKNRARRVEMLWVPVRDHDGRVHMEARWLTPHSAHADTKLTA
ncbi:hypothetical protein [Nocardioides daphniae]|uniref:Uncharacterized protein n=1 Tax=Nocardioides daphniae TaxID=402297 RepID=A0ABQ1Q135_9ACTN|nr:hypothetical protein [Nocardioides daphniae]GGD09455.1 hypothetical protein GCM10007231_05410 [Nocardioides daphniae]